MAIINPVSTGTSSNQGVMQKRSLMVDVNSDISCVLLVSCVKPAMAKISSAMLSEGIVVMSM